LGAPDFKIGIKCWHGGVSVPCVPPHTGTLRFVDDPPSLVAASSSAPATLVRKGRKALPTIDRLPDDVTDDRPPRSGREPDNRVERSPSDRGVRLWPGRDT